MSHVFNRSALYALMVGAVFTTWSMNSFGQVNRVFEGKDASLIKVLRARMATDDSLKQLVADSVGKPPNADNADIKELLSVAQNVIDDWKRRWKDDKVKAKDIDYCQHLVDRANGARVLTEEDCLLLFYLGVAVGDYIEELTQKDRPPRTINGTALCAKHKHPKDGAEMISVVFDEDIGLEINEQIQLYCREQDGERGALLGSIVVLANKGSGIAGHYVGPYIGVQPIVVRTQDIKKLSERVADVQSKERATGRVVFVNPSSVDFSVFVHSWYDRFGVLHDNLWAGNSWSVRSGGVVYPQLSSRDLDPDNADFIASAVNFRIRTKDGHDVISSTAFPHRVLNDRNKWAGDLEVRVTVPKEVFERASRSDPKLTAFNTFLAVAGEVIVRYADEKKGWLAASASVAARSVRDASIRETLRADFFDLDDDAVGSIQTVISLALDDNLTISAAREQASKQAILEALRQRDPNLGKAVQVADFIYEIVTKKQQQAN